MTLRDYARKRRFVDTPEPSEDTARARGRGQHRPIFVVQLHNARARHYDFRLEADGALKSWAVPKGPSLRAGEKRLAVQVEDHPLSYAGFQGEIPEGNYGAGHVLVFDHGVWACDGDPLAAIAAGKLDFTLEGGKLRGGWKLIRTAKAAGKPQWLLVKRKDRHARDVEADDLVEVEPGAESSAKAGRIWISNRDGDEGGERAISPSPRVRGEGGAQRRMRGGRRDATAGISGTASERTATRTPHPASLREAVPRSAPRPLRAAQGRSDVRAPVARKQHALTPAPRGEGKNMRRSDAAWRKRVLALDGARDLPFAAGFKPELATPREAAPRGDDWLHEVKWDGYRMLADLVESRVKLRSRNGLDWTPDFPAIVAAIEALPVSDARLDGELVALDARGVSDFALLQHSLQGSANAPLRYIVFDLPGLAGIDLSGAALLERKRLLQALLAESDDESLVYSQHVVGHGQEVFAASGKRGLEGIISKRIDAPYRQARTSAWVKVKHANSDEFVIVGYSAPKGSRSGFGALLMATPDNGGLRYAGRVGTGFDDETLRTLLQAMQPLRRKTATVALPDHLPYDKRDRGDIAWLQPRLVAEVAFRGWGKDGLLRQASFQRLRDDKTLEDLGMPETGNAKKAARTAPNKKTAARAPAGKPGSKRGRGTAGIEISSRERVVFAEAGITKGDVADYYQAIAEWILPGLAERPLSLLRCPSGAGGECFFQKHHADSLGGQVHAISLKQKSGAEDYLYVRDAAGLLELVQMNALEFHPWGARVDKPELPDTLVFDLDPGPGVDWKQVVAGARDVRARLQDAGLDSFVRLSGGKGVHVVVPIRRGPSWDTVKDFTAAFAEAMTAHKPLTYVATMSKARRDGRIFIDWLRNGRGATSVCSWSLRARNGAPVAMPIRWEELGRVGGPAAFDLRKALKRAKTLKQDPWRGYANTKQSLPKLR